MYTSSGSRGDRGSVPPPKPGKIPKGWDQLLTQPAHFKTFSKIFRKFFKFFFIFSKNFIKNFKFFEKIFKFSLNLLKILQKILNCISKHSQRSAEALPIPTDLILHPTPTSIVFKFLLLLN